MSKIERKNSNANLNQTQGLFSRIGSRILNVIIIIFSPITYLFNRIYSFFFGQSKESKNKEENINQFNEELKKLEDGQEAIITQEMLESDFELTLIDKNEVINSKKINCVYDNKTVTLTLQHELNNLVQVTIEISSDNKHTTSLKQTFNKSDPFIKLMVFPFRQHKIDGLQQVTIESEKDQLIYTYKKDEETNSVKVKKEKIDLEDENRKTEQLSKYWQSELNKMQNGQECILTADMMKRRLGMYFDIDGKLIPLNKIIKCIYIDKVITYKFDHQENGDTKVTTEITDNNNKIIETSTKTFTKEEKESGKDLVSITINSKNIYEMKNLIFEHGNKTSTYYFEKVKDTEDMKIRKTTITNE